MKTVKRFCSLLVVLCLVLACATFTQNAYRTLTVSYQAYDATLSTMGDLYKEGKITEAQKDDAIKIARGYKLAHNDAVAALADFETNGGDTNKAAYTKAAAQAAASLAKLLAYCRPFIEGR
jgi:hypothetical protein